MRYLYFITILIFITSACNTKGGNEVPKDTTTETEDNPDSIGVNHIQKHYENKEIIPFSLDKQKNNFSGTFIVSADYFAEISISTETGYFNIYINGEKSECDLKYSGYPADLQVRGFTLYTKDYNEDGLMDFHFLNEGYEYVYLFDESKKCFTPLRLDNNMSLGKEINNTVGFLSFPEPGEKDGLMDKAEILNKDGSLWMSFYIDYSHHDHQWKENFRPWAFEPGIAVFVVRCIKVNKDSYTIVANEELGMEKYMKKNPNIIFSTVEEHVLKAPILAFDHSNNPIRKEANDQAKTINIEDIYDPDPDIDDFFCGIEMKGDWVKLENIFNEKSVGWVRWRKDNRFMVEFYYSL